jgi:hypothetical protein
METENTQKSNRFISTFNGIEINPAKLWAMIWISVHFQIFDWIVFLLKGQCHEIVVEIRPSSRRLVLNLWLQTLFPLKNSPSQNNGPYSSASINLKISSPDPVDFVTTRLLIHWHTAAVTAQFVKGLCLICHSRGRRSWVVAKSAGSQNPDFTSLDAL